MNFEEFASKLSLIQAEEYLSIEQTIDIKKKIVGDKKIWKCSESELDDILDAYRKEYSSTKVEKTVTYSSKFRHRKSKNKYSHRKDWD